MQFGLFYELQLPRPWGAGDEARMLGEALAQIELADRLGYDCVWVVEHHFLEEYSHSSAPEVFLGAASQRTKRIRLGHGIVQLLSEVNHPVRVAERVAMLDQLSGGRVELGTGVPGTVAELGGFGVDGAEARAQWRECLDAVARMLTETPFAGCDGRWVVVPPRNVVPKPVQRPHPPLWTACGRRQSIGLAARNGLGALSFSFLSPAEAKLWRDDYYEIVASPACVPVGFAVHPSFAVVQNMMCHGDAREARARGLEGAEFLAYSLAHFFGAAPHRPGVTDVWDAFFWGEYDAERGRGAPGAPEARREEILDREVGSLTAELDQTIGTPDQLREVLRGYEDAGVDQVVFISQTGRNRHEHVCESLELFAREVMPEFTERHRARAPIRRDALAPLVEAALARRPPPRACDPDYVLPARRG